jgi:hypothetical protein
MNLYSVAIDTLRGFAVRHRAPRVIEKRTYVFFLVPFDFSKNGSAKKAEVAQGLINGHSDFDRAANYTVAAPPTLSRGEIRGATKTSGERDVDYEPQLNFRLMWTWFLPNPLWKPKRRDLRCAYNTDPPSKTDSPITIDAVVSNQKKERN